MIICHCFVNMDQFDYHSLIVVRLSYSLCRIRIVFVCAKWIPALIPLAVGRLTVLVVSKLGQFTESVFDAY